MKLALGKSRLLTPRTLLLGLSFIAMVICAWAGAAHYRKLAWGNPCQPVWPDHIMMARETLFHYYVWAFLRLFGYNILSYEAALCVIWCTIFIFTLLLVHLLFRSYIVTSVTALVFNFLPFAFIFTF